MYRATRLKPRLPTTSGLSVRERSSPYGWLFFRGRAARTSRSSPAAAAIASRSACAVAAAVVPFSALVERA